MRILTVRQPYAWAIIHGGKDVENRSRNVAGDYRGPVAVHVAQADADDAPEALCLDYANWYRARRPQPKKFDPTWSDRGTIIGVVDLVDVHESHGCAGFNAGLADPVPLCSAWAEHHTHHLVLANPRPLAEPIPYRGALGLRKLDDETTARVLEEIA